MTDNNKHEPPYEPCDRGDHGKMCRTLSALCEPCFRNEVRLSFAVDEVCTEENTRGCDVVLNVAREALLCADVQPVILPTDDGGITVEVEVNNRELVFIVPADGQRLRYVQSANGIPRHNGEISLTADIVLLVDWVVGDVELIG